MIFDERSDEHYDEWLKTPQGRYINRREKELILELMAPRRGEKLLDVGCGADERVLLFKDRGCDVTGVETRFCGKETAGQRLDRNLEPHPRRAAELFFSDNEFDIVCLIASLEFADDPAGAIGEAIRVSRGRVFLGVMNAFSINSVQRKLRGLFLPSLYPEARFFHICELMAIVKGFLPDTVIQWGSVIFLPDGWYGFAARLEETFPVMRNPFGAFLGLSFPVTFSLNTMQDIIGDPFKINAKSGQPVQGAVRGIGK